MSCDITIYKKYWTQAQIDDILEQAEARINSHIMELVALAALTPRAEKDIEGHEFSLHDSIVRSVNEVVGELIEAVIESFIARAAKEDSDTKWYME